jgi:hypothetical protein
MADKLFLDASLFDYSVTVDETGKTRSTCAPIDRVLCT